MTPSKAPRFPKKAFAELARFYGESHDLRTLAAHCKAGKPGFRLEEMRLEEVASLLAEQVAKNANALRVALRGFSRALGKPETSLEKETPTEIRARVEKATGLSPAERAAWLLRLFLDSRPEVWALADRLGKKKAARKQGQTTVLRRERDAARRELKKVQRELDKQARVAEKAKRDLDTIREKLKETRADRERRRRDVSDLRKKLSREVDRRKQAEDRDGFEDADGCPEPDNDKDGIPDLRDKCPNEAEDFDRFHDEDGCPEPDNDKDGVADKDDNCPMDPGPAKTKGCPANMLDDDGDGIPDARDKCPKQAEDKDGFEDADGCPDPDNDHDGICDNNESVQDDLGKYAKTCQGSDKCPMDAEDKDGFQDNDGCPDPDDDGDGFCDNNEVIQKKVTAYAARCVGKDMCPRKPETINGNQDADGCPDKGEPDIKITDRQILLRLPIRFKRETTRFEGRTTSILNQIVLSLRWKLDSFKKLVIVAYVEPKMRPSKARRVSQAWADAIKAYFARLGIPADKIIAKGLGGAKPVYTGHSRSKSRKLNRRVEFYIVR